MTLLGRFWLAGFGSLGLGRATPSGPHAVVWLTHASLSLGASGNASDDG